MFTNTSHIIFFIMNHHCFLVGMRVATHSIFLYKSKLNTIALPLVYFWRGKVYRLKKEYESLAKIL